LKNKLKTGLAGCVAPGMPATAARQILLETPVNLAVLKTM